MKRFVGRSALLISSVLALSAAPGFAQLPRTPVRPIPTAAPGSIRRVLAKAIEMNASGVQSLTLNPDAVYAGQSSTIIVALASAAPASGAKVLLSGAPANVATMPQSLMVPAGQTTASFLVATLVGGADATLTVSAGLEGAPGTLSAALRVVAAVAVSTVESVKVPIVMNSWTPETGTVVLSSAADGNGATVVLSSSNPSVLTVPASIVVPAGQKSQTFALSGTSFDAAGAATVTASLNATTKSANTSVMSGTSVTGFSGFPRYVPVGTSVTGAVQINGVAPAGGVSLPVYVKNYTDAVVPATVVIPAGQSAGPLTITAKQGPGMLFLYRNADDLKSYQGSCYDQYARCIPMQMVKTPTLMPLEFVICKENTSACTVKTTTVEGGASIQLEIARSNSWPDPMVVTLSSSNPQAAPIEASVTFQSTWPAGFATVKTGAVTAPTTVTFTASCAICTGGSQSALLQINPGTVVSALSVPQMDIKGGTSTTGTITLSKAAGAAGAKVDLTSSNSSICGVPASVTIQAGQTSGTFVVTTQKVLSTAAVTLGGSVAGGAAKTATVRVVP